MKQSHLIGLGALMLLMGCGVGVGISGGGTAPPDQAH